MGEKCFHWTCRLNRFPLPAPESLRYIMPYKSTRTEQTKDGAEMHVRSQPVFGRWKWNEQVCAA